MKFLVNDYDKPMSDFKSYEFSVKIKTNRAPKEQLWRIVQKLKDVVPVLSIEYNLIDERPTTTEHHGGNNEGPTD